MPEFRTIPMADIDAPAVPLREAMDEEKLDLLTRSMDLIGLLYPLLVKMRDGRYEIEDGHRRFVAASRLRWREILCEIKADEELHEHAAKIHANLMREDNTAAEEAVYLAQLALDNNQDLAKVMEITGLGEQYINQRLELLDGDQEVLAAVKSRAINFSQARELNRIKDEGFRREYLAHAVRGGAPARLIREWREALERNNVTSGQQPQPEAPHVPHTGSTPPSIVCFHCGAFKDTWNMSMIWIHNHELAEYAKLRDCMDRLRIDLFTVVRKLESLLELADEAAAPADAGSPKVQ